jgi:hypothetical protein
MLSAEMEAAAVIQPYVAIELEGGAAVGGLNTMSYEGFNECG